MVIGSDTIRGVLPSPGVAGIRPYSVPKHGAPIDLKLDANEGEAPPPELLEQLGRVGSDLMRRYPDTSSVQTALAATLGVDPANIIVTAGGDDALDRLCRATLTPGRELLTTDPSFEMLPRYARIAGAAVREVDWPHGAFPTEAMIAAVSPATALLAVVSPNNPSGAVATADDLRRLSAAAPDAILLCDFAYIEFADEDLTEVALALPNAIVMRTLSKAWSCAGLRVGYAVGPRELIGWMRAAGGPYAVARPSIALAAARLAQGPEPMRRFVAQVREDRALITSTLRELGASVPDSQGNFVFATLDRAAWLTDALAGQGIAIRAYPGHPRLGNSLRITCPGDRANGVRLAGAIRQALAPEALILSNRAVQLGGITADEMVALAARLPLGLVGGDGVSPDALRKAMGDLNVTHVWFVCAGDREVAAARAASVVPLAVADPGEDFAAAAEKLTRGGAARALRNLGELPLG